MNRYLIFGISGALGAGLLAWNIWMGAVIGLITAIVTAPASSTKRVIIEDITTGEIKIQPNDKATQRYISGRGE
jgi:hypothetical protein